MTNSDIPPLATAPVDVPFSRRLLLSTLFTSGMAFAAGCAAFMQVRWSVKPALSPWSVRMWPYVVYASASVIWLSLLTLPLASATKRLSASQIFLIGLAAFAGPLPMLVLSGCITRPDDPWLPMAAVLAVAIITAGLVWISRKASIGVGLSIRFGLFLWLFVLPAAGLLEVGISTRHFPPWARLGALYWLYRLVQH